jgi:hypothetical protein
LYFTSKILVCERFEEKLFFLQESLRNTGLETKQLAGEKRKLGIFSRYMDHSE